MEHNVLNGNFACSTLIIGNFAFLKITFPRFLEILLDSFDVIGGIYIEEQDGHEITSHSFITASTTPDQRESAEVHLRKLGFKPHGPVYNKKNGTEVTFWILDIPKFIKNVTRQCKLNKVEMEGTF